MNKGEWRIYYKELLRQQMPWTKSEIVTRIDENLIEFLSQQSGVWGAYQSMEQEPSLKRAITTSKHLEWVYPKMHDKTLRFYRTNKFEKGPYGVLEPDLTEAEEVSLDRMSGVLLPGLGFDGFGGRLGKGKGFYDRALSEYKGRKIGVCFSCQVTKEKLPVDDYDVKIHAVLNEDGIFSVGSKGN